MREMLLGATAMGCFCIALFFARFWRDTRDVLHLCFAVAFLILGAQRILLAAWQVPDEALPFLYVPRLAAYLVILGAIAAKNVATRR